MPLFAVETLDDNRDEDTIERPGWAERQSFNSGFFVRAEPPERARTRL